MCDVFPVDRTSRPRTPAVSRRSVLRASATLGAAAMLAGATACSGADEASPVEPDPLVAEARRARSDAAAARAVLADRPDLVDTMTVVADQRTAHADALDAEIVRVTLVTATTTSTTTASVQPSDIPTPAQLRDDLTESAQRAATLARSTQGYRGGLLGSISASCTLVAAAIQA
ncbi:hypothetical protein HQ609_03575 [Rhodococcus corynebacterioides]|nr:hypothetical protein [Rhodococcus corynebacterioides]